MCQRDCVNEQELFPGEPEHLVNGVKMSSRTNQGFSRYTSSFDAPPGSSSPSTIFGNLDQSDRYAGEYSHQRLYVALILLTALFLRLYRLSSQSIWVDEMLTISSSGINVPLSPIDIFDNLHGPLHSIIMFLWVKLAGDSEFALRLPSVIFSVLSMLAIYKVVLKLSDSRTAVIALTVMAVSPFHIWYAQEARNYSMLLFFSALSFGGFLDLLSEPTRNNFWRYVLFTLAAFLSNMSAAFIVIVQDIFFLFSPRKLSLRSLVLAHVFLALLLLPWLTGMFQRVEFHRLARTAPYPESEFLRGPTTSSPFALPYTFFVFSLGYSLGPSLTELHESIGLASFARYAPVLIPAALGFSLALVLGIISLRHRKRLLFLLLIWIVLPLAVVSFFALKNFKPFNPRYVMVSYPAYVMLLAEGLLLRKRSLKGAVIRLALCTLILVTVLVSLRNYYDVAAYGKDDFRSAARTLQAEFAPGDVVFAEGTYEPLNYYLRNTEKAITILPLYRETIGSDARLRVFVLEKSQDADRVWLLTSRLWDLDPEKKVPELFRQIFVIKREFHLQGVDLALLTKK